MFDPETRIKWALTYISLEDGHCDPYCCQGYLDELREILLATPADTKGASE